MSWKKLGKALLFPHIAIVLVLVPVAATLLIGAFTVMSEDDPIRIAVYVISFYTLLIICCRIPRIVHFFRNLRQTNKYLARWGSDVHLRMRLSLYGTFIYNVAYGIFQLCLGIYHGSLWYDAMAAYYILLAVMRFFLLRYTRAYRPGELMENEWKKYLFCGACMLLLNLVLSGIVFFTIFESKALRHHEITVIAMAAYTFTAFTASIVGVVKYRKYNSPVFSAAKATGLVCACVSMLTLENAMLTAFGGGDDSGFRHTMISATGGVIFAFVLGLAVYMVVMASNKLKHIRNS